MVVLELLEGLTLTYLTWIHQSVRNAYGTEFIIMIVNWNSCPYLIQAYYLPETEYVHWARAHPVRNICTTEK